MSRDPGRPRGAMLLVVMDDRRLVLHKRDDVPGIAHPGRWAGFGGAVEAGESVEQALRREVKEETGIDVVDPIFLTEEIDHEGDGRCVALFYVLGSIVASDIELREGVGVGCFKVAELDALDVAPFVQRAITSHLVKVL